jgi:diacylglycerol kinase family enzyme
VALRLRRNARPKLGKASYVVVALLRELPALKRHRLAGTLDGRVLEAESVMMVACLGRYFGAGMMIGPDASPLADHFQMVWSHGAEPLQLLGLLPGIHRGKHLDHPSVRSCSAQHLRVEAAPPAPVEAEGEPLGWTPLSVQILPRALSFVPP